MTHRDKPKADPVQPVKTEDEADHRDKSPSEHPRSRRPNADTRPDDVRSGSEGNLETGSNADDEDARSRRRDIGP